MIHTSEMELIERLKHSDRSAFNFLFSKYKSEIYNYILKQTGNRELAEEILQETFTKLWLYARQFDESKGSLRNWLYTIAVNLTRNEFSRKRYDYHYDDIIQYHDILEGQERTDRLATLNEAKGKLAIALRDLQPELREVIILKEYQELKFREIEEITGISANTLKARFQRALLELRVKLEGLEL